MQGLAIEFDAATGSFSRREYPRPVPGPGEILVDVSLCTICGSDLHTYQGRRGAPPGCILGHEIIGTVAEWGGPDVPRDFHGQPLNNGQRITWALAVGCGECFFCHNGLPQKCGTLFKYGHESGTGQPAGGLSRYCVLVPGTPVFRVPASLSDQVACPANCATATVAAGMRMLEQTHDPTGTVAVVMGAGMLGLTATAWLNRQGTRQIVVVDPLPERVGLAREFGASHGLDTTDPQVIGSLVDSLSGGRGADIALDFAGTREAVATCLDQVRAGGCVLLAGSVYPTEGLVVSPEKMVRDLVTIRGLHNYRADDLDRALVFLDQNRDRFPFDQLVPRTFGLAETAAAFEFAASGQAIRVAVRPGD